MVMSNYQVSLPVPSRPGNVSVVRRAEQTEEVKRLRRRVAVFRRSGVIGEPDPQIAVHRAMTAEELRAAYRLVHEAYVEQGYITNQPGGVRVRPFEALPEMATYVAVADGRVVGVMSVVPDSRDLGLPSDKAFKEELDALRSRGRRLSEITNLAVVSDFRSSIVLMELSRAVYAYGRWAGLDDFFISISPGHGKFFESILQFAPCGDIRNYGDATIDMVEGKLFDITTGPANWLEADELLGPDAFLYDWFESNSPYFRVLDEQEQRARRLFLEPTLLRRLFVEASDLLVQCTPQSRQAILRRWGTDLYREVVGLPQPAARPAVSESRRPDGVMSQWLRWMSRHRLLGRRLVEALQ